ncbi:MAG: hypothetical protein HPY83_16190 [Anaerolineae bacterium]|nr:hypothetical protein [Anaerolineae bacterium]
MWLPTVVLTLAATVRLVGLARVPPGLQHDEVFKTIFSEQVRAGHFPVFFDLNGGNEPFFAYLVTGTLALFGPNVLALRWPAVAGGLLGVASVWWTARRMFSLRVAALATILMSVSLWHVMDSRVSLRAIWLPTIMTLSYGFLWGWLRSARKGELLIGAGLLGLSLYTYTSAVLGVAVVVAFGLLCLASADTRKAGLGLVAASAVALALGLPLALHMARVPEATVRVRALDQGLVALRAGDPMPVLTSAAKVAGMFAVTGDPEWRYNVSGRPVFWPVLGLALYAGMWACWRKRKERQYILATLWLVVNLGASAVTSGAPSSLRALGAAPAAYVVAALGCWWLWDAAVRQGWHRAASVALVAVVAAEAASSLYGYFVTWPRHPEVREIYRADLADVAGYLAQSNWTGEVMLSVEYAADLDRLSFEYLGFTDTRPRYFDGSHTLIIPDGPALILVPRLRPIAPALVPVLQGTAQLVAQEPRFDAWLVPGANRDSGHLASSLASELARTELPAEVEGPWPGPVLRIRGVAVPGEVVAGEALEAVVRFEVPVPAPGGRSIKLFGHLRDQAGFLWSQADALTYPTSDWRVGDEVYQVLSLPIPSDMPGSTVHLEVGVYEDAGGPFQLLLGAERLPFTRLTAGHSLVVSGGGAGPDEVRTEMASGLVLGHSHLAGSSVVSRILRPGGDAEVWLWWEGEPDVSSGWALRRQGEEVPLREVARSASGSAQPGRLMRDRRRLAVPPEAARGEWELVLRAGPNLQSETSLGPVFVAGVERDFSVPVPAVPADVEFEGLAQLTGLAQPIERVRRGDSLSVELLWRCLRAFERDHTVFVHLVSAEGRTVAGHDGPPGGGTRPTRSWLPNETVHDPHVLHVPPDMAAGTYYLVAGLYLADVPGYPRLGVSRAGTAAGSDSAIIAAVEVVE